ncbi:site-specific integrase [Tepidanaerobacter acetatoxydans]|uniref:site-specific integrase n=1 Tax=Tepidanaerobacter acetatoxydans TaxID=499229 RepID=UPI001BD21E93|nr:site-specific integrase [Tepidanaerobacter acetatoxydans]
MPVYKDEERKTWYVWLRYKDWAGVVRQHKKRGFQKKSEAVQYERDFLKKQSGSCDMSFGSMVELYMEDCKSRLRSTTYESKKYLIESKILPTFKDLPVNAITAATVRKWQNELLDDDAEYSPTYLKTINNQLSAIFNFAKRYYGLSTNPAAVAGSIGKKNAEAMQFWTKDEFQLFIEAVSDKPASYAIFNTLFWTGMRSGELLALTLDDVNFEAKTISITKSYARIGGEDVISPPKTPKSRRVITVPDFLLDILEDYAGRLVDYEPSDRLFEYTKHYLQSEMTRGCKKSGVKKIRVHDIRHSHASLLIELGFSPLLISERLGHENVETTLETYAHLYPDKHGEVSSKLNKLFTPKICQKTDKNQGILE